MSANLDRLRRLAKGGDAQAAFELLRHADRTDDLSLWSEVEGYLDADMRQGLENPIAQRKDEARMRKLLDDLKELGETLFEKVRQGGYSWIITSPEVAGMLDLLPERTTPWEELRAYREAMDRQQQHRAILGLRHRRYHRRVCWKP